MTNASHPSSVASPAGTALSGLGQLVAIVFLGVLSVGVPLPALSLYVHDRLGFSTVVVGLVVGLQSVATILTRHAAGTLSDRAGPRRAVMLGLPLSSAAGLLYLASALAPLDSGGRLALLLLGRVMLGLGESLFITGAMAWGIGRMGPARTGMVMSWQGIAMYAALGLGAPLGLAVESRLGFAGVAALTVGMPLVAVVPAMLLPAVPGGGGARVPFHRVVGLIWRPGIVLMLATVPFAAMATFLSLDFAARNWSGAGLAFTGFGGAYILVRLFGAQLPDRFGGIAVASASLAVEVLGQGVLWLAPAPAVAAVGAALTGAGFSLIFPTMGVAATRRVAPEMRGRAVGNFIAFFDLALGLTGPVVGVVVGAFGYASAFAVGAGATLTALALLIAFRDR